MKLLKGLISAFIFTLLLPGCLSTKKLAEKGPDFILSADSVRFVVIGDYGYAGNPAYEVSQMVKGWQPDFILTTGDNNYNYGLRSTLYDHIGQYYCDYIYNPDATIDLQCKGRAFYDKQNRFFPTLGNHDYDSLFNNSPYFEYFTLPGNEEYYDFNWGPVHVLSFNSMKRFEPYYTDFQKRWLKKKLELSNAPFKILVFHHPPYSSGYHGSSEWIQWDFAEWGATAVFNGHEHFYARLHVKDEPEFPYFVTGSSGHSLRPCGERPVNANKVDEFCYDKNYGAMLVTATERKIVFEFYSLDNPKKPIDRYVVEHD